MAADHNSFANLIWQIADILRGPYRPPQYERVMLPRCDAVASEVLAPSEHVTTARDDVAVQRTAKELTRELRVSPLVAVQRVVEQSQLPARTFERCFNAALEALPKASGSTGGNFYATALKRVGHRFARDVIASALEGNTTFTEAFRLLGVRNSTAFHELSRRLGLAP